MNAAAARRALETRQIPIYLAAIGLGAALASLAPAATAPLDGAVTPVLAALLYTTFLQVPLADLGRAWADRRFLGALLAANFLAVPLVVAALFAFVPADPAVRLGVLLVLLTPCVDYVVVFTHLGRGDSRLVLAATPILLLVQMALLPLFLRLFLGPAAAELLRPGPFLAAFAWLIAAPLALAWLTELWARRRAAGARFAEAMAWGPVPLMALTLLLVVAAQLPRIESAPGDVLAVVPVYLAYLVAAPALGLAVARLFALDAGAGRALVFSTSTRNSLVVLPLALAAPFAGGLVAAVVVTQTLVELLGELAYIRLVPALLRERGKRRH